MALTPDPFDFPNLPEEIRQQRLAIVKAAMPWLDDVFKLSNVTKRRMSKPDPTFYLHSSRIPDKPYPIEYDTLSGMAGGRSRAKWESWCVGITGGFPPASVGKETLSQLLSIANVTEIVEEADTTFQDLLYLFVQGHEAFETEKEAIDHRKDLREFKRIMTQDSEYTTCNVALDTRRAYITLLVLQHWLASMKQQFKASELPKLLRESGWEVKTRKWGNFWQSPVNYGPIADISRSVMETA